MEEDLCINMDLASINRGAQPMQLCQHLRRHLDMLLYVRVSGAGMIVLVVLKVVKERKPVNKPPEGSLRNGRVENVGDGAEKDVVYKGFGLIFMTCSFIIADFLSAPFVYR